VTSLTVCFCGSVWVCTLKGKRLELLTPWVWERFLGWGANFPPPFPLPFPSSHLPFHYLLSCPPSLRSRLSLFWLGLGERFSSPSTSGQSPATKQYLVNFMLKISPLVAMIFSSFSGSETSNWGTGWPSGNILDFHARLLENWLNKKPS